MLAGLCQDRRSVVHRKRASHQSDRSAVAATLSVRQGDALKMCQLNGASVSHVHSYEPKMRPRLFACPRHDRPTLSGQKSRLSVDSHSYVTDLDGMNHQTTLLKIPENPFFRQHRGVRTYEHVVHGIEPRQRIEVSRFQRPVESIRMGPYNLLLSHGVALSFGWHFVRPGTGIAGMHNAVLAGTLMLALCYSCPSARCWTSASAALAPSRLRPRPA